MKYTVKVKEVNYGTIEVEATSPEDALGKAETQYTMGNAHWDCGDYELSDAKLAPKRDRDAR